MRAKKARRLKKSRKGRANDLPANHHQFLADQWHYLTVSLAVSVFRQRSGVVFCILCAKVFFLVSPPPPPALLAPPPVCWLLYSFVLHLPPVHSRFPSNTYHPYLLCVLAQRALCLSVLRPLSCRVALLLPLQQPLLFEKAGDFRLLCSPFCSFGFERKRRKRLRRLCRWRRKLGEPKH